MTTNATHSRYRGATPADEQYERMLTTYAFARLSQLGWQWEADAAGCWDILTPAGWRTCWCASDLCAAIDEGLAVATT